MTVIGVIVVLFLWSKVKSQEPSTDYGLPKFEIPKDDEEEQLEAGNGGGEASAAPESATAQAPPDAPPTDPPPAG